MAQSNWSEQKDGIGFGAILAVLFLAGLLGVIIWVAKTHS